MKNNKNNKIKSHLRKGDTVIVIAGDSKGKTGEVETVLHNEYRAIVKGVNMVKRHVKPTAEQVGGIVEKEAPIHISNLMLVDASGTASRVKKSMDDNGKKVRISKKTNEII
jgi:large subunit ribosomal protein L24